MPFLLLLLLAVLPVPALHAQGSSVRPPLLAPVEAPASEAVLDLREDLGAILRNAPGGAEFGVQVVSLDRGDTLFAWNPGKALIPASNLKLYSTAAAFYYLGPEYRFSTYLFATGDQAGNALEGDLVLYGTGDPTISGRLLDRAEVVYEAFADTLLARGITEIHGDLLGDGSYFDAAWIGQAWEDDDRLRWYAAPVGALNFAENIITLVVRPGPFGKPARIETHPATVGLKLENRVRTAPSGRNRLTIRHEGPYLVVEGQVRSGSSGLRRRVPVADPANYAAAALRGALEARGIRVTGATKVVTEATESIRTGARPAEGAGRDARLLAVHLSPSLSEIAAITNHVSHNLYAEALLKAVGRVARGEGSAGSGAEAVGEMLVAEAGLAPDDVRIADGSGLSRLNRLSARGTIRLLDYMTRSGSWDSFYHSLPQAATPRGLRRMEGTPAAGNLRAKTGTIRGVSALSGYVTSAGGERLAFSILGNGLRSTRTGKRLEDQIAVRLSRFARSEEPSGSAPSEREPQLQLR